MGGGGHGKLVRWRRLLICMTTAAAAAAAGARQQPAGVPPQAQAPTSSPSAEKPPTHITPEQAKQLFALVDELIKFSSQETGLPIKSTVKRQITTRAAVESYLKEKFDEDEGAKRMQRDEIVLKKFGLLDRDFALKPFLLALLKEQIEAYYDSKTKTVNMLDWVDIDEQKPVLAHELTHALQDQHADLEKWNDQTPDDVSPNSSGDTDHLAKDEMDTARDAVAEGQATAVMMDYILKPMGKSLVKDPEVMDLVKQQMTASEDSPVLARAPLLLSESLLFPYREGLSFEQDVWMDQGQAAAFAGALDRPPTSTWEIINPREYEKKHIPAVPLAARHSSPRRQALQALRHRPGGPARPAHPRRNLWRRERCPRPDPGLGWRHLLGRPAAQRQDAGRAGQHQIPRALLSLGVEERRLRRRPSPRLYANELGRKYSGLKPDTRRPASWRGRPSSPERRSRSSPPTKARS